MIRWSALVLTLASLGVSQGKEKEKATVKEKTTEKAPAKVADPHVIIKELYAADKAEKSPFFQIKDRALVDKYFTKDFADLIWKDTVDAKGDLGAIDFNPLYGSQDPQIKNLVIMDTGWGGDKKSSPEDEAVVQVTFKDSGKETMISFQFRQGKDKSWKIEDIRYPNSENMLLKDLLKKAHK